MALQATLGAIQSALIPGAQKGGTQEKGGEQEGMLVQRLISQGDVDYASWRKRKAAREERERGKMKRPKFDYVDPVDDVR